MRVEERAGRTCYGHLAGRLGVAVAEALVERRVLCRTEAAFVIEDGDWFAGEGVARVWIQDAYAKACLDGSERRWHLGGRLGRALYESWRLRGLVKAVSGRAVWPTAEGWQHLLQLGVDELQCLAPRHRHKGGGA